MIDQVDPFQNPRFAALRDKVANDIYFSPYESDGRERDEKLANGAFEAFVEGGRAGAEQFCQDYVLDEDWTPRDQLAKDVREKLPEYEDELGEILHDDPVLAALVAYDLEQAFIDAVVDKVDATPWPSALDIIPSSMDVLVGYSPGLPEGLSVEDQNVMAISRQLPLDLAMMPGPAYSAFFEFVNVSKSAWLGHIRNVHGIDLEDASTGAAAYSNCGEEFGKLADLWRKTEWGFNAREPQLASLEDMHRIVENTDQYSVPILFVKFPLRRFIDTVDLTQPLRLEPGRKSNVGEFGLHNFIHGSGYVELAIKEPINILPGKGRWLTTENPNGFLIGMRKVYDPVESHLQPSFKANIVTQDHHLDDDQLTMSL